MNGTVYRNAGAVLVATIVISVSEFVRNEFLFKSYWVNHYAGLGLVFPSEPINGAIWGLWSLLFAIAILVISRRFTLAQTTGLAWFVGFVLMWVVTANMAVLPMGILIFAVPLSFLETFLAALAITRVAPASAPKPETPRSVPR